MVTTGEGHLLVVLAHPDDEAFGCAGLMALHRRRGLPVTHVCATTGQMGRRMGQPPFANRETLPALRERELREALRVLGVTDLRLLGLWDKTVEFRDPEELADRVASILEEVRPTTVVTFHPEHGGHPDHNAIGAATVRAVRRRTGDARPRVLCPVVPLAGRPPELPMEVVDITGVRAVKEAAFRAHRSQTEGWEERLAKDERLREHFQRLFAEERFWVYPL
ncbi:MAG: bacillithiol biosynthesis deacetylase BshB2 [Clostridia bacterium]|nr:bacillithiol biosynthesis deacetylase BshB2 [Clostridia bacterium]